MIPITKIKMEKAKADLIPYTLSNQKMTISNNKYLCFCLL
jgi:hypothetical protein